ncbi:Hypothetical protein PBC10988_24690 [Planctomycetales bacterium 10988]|nr:Hypothetical protein PBC10988_24690 [Planctomycetales bacterium 10988]
MQRRTLDFGTGQEVIEDIQHLQTVGYQKLGNWNLSENCDHLHRVMQSGLNGFQNFRVTPLLRWTIGPYYLRKLMKTRQMPTGYSTIKSLVPEGHEGDDSEKIADCIKSVRQIEAMEGPPFVHPIFGKMTVEEFKQLQWIHAGLHLSHLIPKSEAETSASQKEKSAAT